MNKPKILFTGLILILLISCLNAQNNNYECITCKQDTLIKDIRVYGGLIHQHQDFFHKAFSFQGIEAGAIINHKLLAGAFGALFVSNLEIKTANDSPLFVNIKEAGLFVGKTNNDARVIHTGWLLNMGYFSLTGDKTDFALFRERYPLVQLSGLVLSPQVFAEMNITGWLKLRTGLTYSFYSFEDQSLIKKTDLNNIALTFGFIIGKFQ
ncbi:MAG: hypothetical protein PHT07_17450 [Paludibacter sp.]|nr:hypothetical protein [Paludibacter sp.]